MDLPQEVVNKLERGKPADYSFKRMTTIRAIGLEGARYTRVGGVPDKGPERKFLTKSLWLNNNKLKSTQNLDELVNAVLEYPSLLGWIDFSFNYITEIEESILKFPNLKILYFHGNCINDLSEVSKLRSLEQLRSVTFHGNPIANHPKYRNYIVSVLPQIINLDFSPIVKTEKMFPIPTELAKKLKEQNKDKAKKK